MKKNLSFILTCLTLPVWLTAVSCREKEIEPEEPAVQITFKGSFALNDAESEDNANISDYIWTAESDRIGIFAFGNDSPLLANAYFSAAASSKNSGFKTKNEEFLIDWKDDTEYGIYAYYPWRKNYTDFKSIPLSIAPEQSGKPGVMPKKSDFVSYAAPYKGGRLNGDVMLDFRQAFSVVRLSMIWDRSVSATSVKLAYESENDVMSFTEGGLNLENGVITPMEGMSNAVTFTSEEPLILSRQQVTLNFMVAPATAGKKIRLIVDFNGSEEEICEFEIPEDGFKPGYLYKYEYSKAGQTETIDLSRNGTANTYIVNKGGSLWSIDASVRGNGIGRTYTWTDKGNTKSKSYTMEDLLIDPVNAKVVWYNTPLSPEGINHKSPVVIESIYYDSDGKRIYFETPEDFVEGNALIAAYDSEGTVLWSWNIWAVKDYNPETLATNVNGYVFMDRNLGAIRGKEVMDESGVRAAAWALGNYYQWGKKDPYPAAAEYKDIEGINWGLPTWTPIEELQQDFSSESWGSKDMMFGNVSGKNCYGVAKYYGETFTIDQAIEAGVQHPYKWITSGPNDGVEENPIWRPDQSFTWMMNGSLADEYVTDWHYLWGGPDLNDNVKSVHDPCPAGWKVAPPKALAAALTAEKVKKPHGLLTTAGLYFPYTGQRTASFGGSQIKDLTKEYVFMSCSGFLPSDRVHPLRASEAGVTAWNSYACAGYQLRCVKEEKVEGGASSQLRAVVIGDSITEVWEARTDNKGFFKDNNYLPKGISGQTSGQIKDRFEADVLLNYPIAVSITCGINDLAGNDNNNIPRSIEHVFNNIKAMAEMAEAAGIKVVIGSTPPSNFIHWLSGSVADNVNKGLGQKVVDLNKMLKEYAEAKGFAYADFHSALKDEDNDLKEEYRFTGWGQNDHVHPNAAGYALMEPILIKAINQAINPNGSSFGGDIDDIGKEEWK